MCGIVGYTGMHSADLRKMKEFTYVWNRWIYRT